jgi:hypothetical protein
MAKDDRARRWWLGRETLQASRAADSMACEPTDLLADLRRNRRNGVVVARRDSHHPRLLGRSKSDRKHRPERDRHLPEDVSREARADDALDPVNERNRLDATLEQAEERAFVTLVRGVFARSEADVRCGARQPVLIGCVEPREDRDPAYLIGRHHAETRETV